MLVFLKVGFKVTLKPTFVDFVFARVSAGDCVSVRVHCALGQIDRRIRGYLHTQ